MVVPSIFSTLNFVIFASSIFVLLNFIEFDDKSIALNILTPELYIEELPVEILYVYIIVYGSEVFLYVI